MTVFYTHFEMCSMAFLLLLMYLFFTSRRVKNPSMHIYAIYLPLAFCVMLLDILSVIFLSSELVNTLFLGLQVCLAPVYLLYALSLVNQITHKNRWWVVASMIPAALMCLTVLTNHWTSLIFYIDEAGRYYHSKLHSMMYVVAGLYMMAALATTIRWRRQLDRRKEYTIYAITCIITVMMLAQLLLRNYLLVGTGVVLGQYMMFNAFQNPMEYADPTTGLLNRSALISRFRRQRVMGRPFCVGVISMRAFRSINDVFGIATGDALLKQVSQYLTFVCGAPNTYRFMGDVFVALFADGTAMDSALSRIERRFDDVWPQDDLLIRLAVDRCLIGAERCACDADELVKLIEFSIRESKLHRSDARMNVDGNISEAMRRNAAIEQALQRVIEQGEIEMHYQPLYEVRTGGFPTFEALARLRLDGEGYVPPDEFIRLAERTGMISRLGETILESVCRFLRDERPQRYGVTLAQINLSVVQCMDEGFARRCVDIFKRYDIDPSMICLEITETAASYSDQTLHGNMATLRALGVSFALDDYGSGYSTADYVMRMPFSHIKLDKKLVSDSAVNERSRLLVCSLAEMFLKLGFHVVAEGVETREEADRMVLSGAEYLQGYLYARPLPKDEYMAFLAGKDGEIALPADIRMEIQMQM